MPRLKDQKCHWRRHYPSGTCARDLIGLLEYLATKNSKRFIYATVPSLTRLCNGKYRRSGKPHSQRMVEKCLNSFRRRNFLSEIVTHEIDGVELKGRVLNSHDVMTALYPLACCLRIGLGPGVWTPDGRSYSNPEEVSEFALIIEDENCGTRCGPGADAGAVPSAVPGAVRGAVQNVNSDGVNDGADDGIQSLQMEVNTSDTSKHERISEMISQPDSNANLFSPISQVSPSSLLTANNPAAEQTNCEIKTETSTSTSQLTDLTKASAKEKPKASYTITQHFDSNDTRSARDFLRILSDGELEYENPTMNAYLKKDFECELLVQCCREAVQEFGTKQAGRGVLSDVMHAAAAKLRKNHKLNAPKPWYVVIGRLRKGDDALQERDTGDTTTFAGTQSLRNYCNPFAHTWLHEMFHNAVMKLEVDLTPWEKYFVSFPKERVGYAKGWEWLHVLLGELKEAPQQLVAVRDWLWEADATHAKDAVPLWRIE